MQTIKKSLFLCKIIFLLTILSACKKIEIVNDNNGSAELKKLLVGTPGNVWRLHDADASTVWEHQIDAGWVKYTNQLGHINLTDCVKDNDYMVFRSDYTYTQATFTCNLFETNFPRFKETGGPGKWMLGADNSLNFENYASYRLISVTATNLVIANLNGTYFFESVSNRPFLTPQQQLCGSENKLWKISKVKLGGVDQPLSAAQLVSRLNFNVNGTLTYTSTSQPSDLIKGTWNYNLSQSRYQFTVPPVGQTPAVNQQCTVLELTATAFTYYYFDAQNNYHTIYLVPQT